VDVVDIFHQLFNLLRRGVGQILKHWRQYDVLYQTVRFPELFMHFLDNFLGEKNK